MRDETLLSHDDESLPDSRAGSIASLGHTPAEPLAMPSAPPTPAAVYLSSLQSDHSRTTMARQLRRLAQLAGYDSADACPWWNLRIHHTTAIRAELARTLAPATGNLMLSALRGVLKKCWQMELMDAEAYHRAASVEQIKGNAPAAAAGRALNQQEINALLAACDRDRSAQGRRDAALIAIAYTLGLRRAELVALDVAHLDRARGMLTVRGKGNKTRTVYVRGGTHLVLEDWLAVRGLANGPLFTRLTTRGKAHQADQRLTSQTVYNVLATRAKQAGLASFSPHDLRRTMIGDYLDRGADIVTVAAIAGHASVATTARYDRRGERAKQAAADLLHVPYRPSGPDEDETTSLES